MTYIHKYDFHCDCGTHIQFLVDAEVDWHIARFKCSACGKWHEREGIKAIDLKSTDYEDAETRKDMEHLRKIKEK